jgi:hypothetical protein
VCFCLAHHHHHHHPGENLKGKFFKNGFDFLYLRKVRRISLVPFFFFFSTCFFVLFFRTSCIYIYPPTREREGRDEGLCADITHADSRFTQTHQKRKTPSSSLFYFLFFLSQRRAMLCTTCTTSTAGGRRKNKNEKGGESRRMCCLLVNAKKNLNFGEKSNVDRN